jgi:hypothetical protein
MGRGTVWYALMHLPDKHTDTMADCLIFATDESDDESDESVTARGVGRGKKKDLWPLLKNSNGKVMLPSLDTNGGLALGDKKSIVRSFLTHSYRKFLFFVTPECPSHWSR